MDPLHLEPRLVAKPWGGRRLQRFGRDLPPGVCIGESWEVADLDPRVTDVNAPISPVAVGPWRGHALCDLIAHDRDALLGDSLDVDGRFPVLLKLLDAREHLSVQVHPPAPYVAANPAVRLKTESWVVLDSDPGAGLFIGVADGVTPDDLVRSAGTPRLASLLRRVPAITGEVHHLPAGTIHALGAGVVVAEVQTPSDTTFRLYDWTVEYGRAPRELHVAAAIEVVTMAWEANTTPGIPLPAGTEAALVDTPEYRLHRFRLADDAIRAFTPGRVRVVQVLLGALHGDDLSWPVTAGACVVLPASWTGVLRAVGETTFLEVTC